MNYLRPSTLFLVAFLLGSLVLWSGTTGANTSSYTNAHYGYSLIYRPTLRDLGERDYAATDVLAQLLDDKSFVVDDRSTPLSAVSINVRVMANPGRLTLTEYAAQHPATLRATVRAGQRLELSNGVALQQIEDGTGLFEGTYQVVTYMMSTDRADRAYLIIGRSYTRAAVEAHRADYDLMVRSFRLNASSAQASTDAIYLSVGDEIQYGFGGDPRHSSAGVFRSYLESRLGRPVDWATLANADTAIGAVTTAAFITSDFSHKSQLELAVSALQEYRREHRPVVAITLSIGGNDLVEVGNACHTPPCLELYEQARTKMAQRLDQIYQEISAAKDPATPLFVLTYYNASDCGQPGVGTSPTELGVRGWNATMTEVATKYQLFIVDGYMPVRGRACELVRNLNLTGAGQAVIAKQHSGAYDALPASYVEPFDESPHLNR
jgi:lysophospholipase L1-like esterase